MHDTTRKPTPTYLVGHEHDRLAPELPADALVEEVLGDGGIHRRQHVVQQVQVRVRVDGPGQRHAGPLPARQIHAQLPDRCHVPRGQTLQVVRQRAGRHRPVVPVRVQQPPPRVDEGVLLLLVVSPAPSSSPRAPLSFRIPGSKETVVPDGPRLDPRLLRAVGQPGPRAHLGASPAGTGRLAQHCIEQSRLAAADRTGDHQQLPRPHRERDALEVQPPGRWRQGGQDLPEGTLAH